VNTPSNEIHPRKGSREGETRNNGIERLSLELTGDGSEYIGSGRVRHFIIG
jgi:hypothetical protein